jgi:NADH dehydrogenase FAD-containing subunit
MMYMKALSTDGYLRVKGVNNVYAIGDCSTVDQEKLINKFSELFKSADRNGDGVLSMKEFEDLVHECSKTYPQMRIYGRRVKELFDEADVNKDGRLSLQEFESLLKIVDQKLRPLPATAQVAYQQGGYVANSLNQIAKGKEPEMFVYNHLGSFSFIGGNKSVAEIQGHAFGGFGTWLAWRGIYWSKISLRNKACLTFDWLKTSLFGRDVSRY